MAGHQRLRTTYSTHTVTYGWDEPTIHLVVVGTLEPCFLGFECTGRLALTITNEPVEVEGFSNITDQFKRIRGICLKIVKKYKRCQHVIGWT